MCTYIVSLYVFACIFVHSTYLYEEKNVMILYRVDNLILFAQGSHISIDIALYAAPGIVITPCIHLDRLGQTVGETHCPMS